MASLAVGIALASICSPSHFKLPESAVEDDDCQEVGGGQHPEDVKHREDHGDNVAVHSLLLGWLPEIAPRLRQGS